MTIKANRHYSETSSYAAVLQNNYLRWHHYYHPADGDQWPEDKAKRPGMIHITHNIIQPAIDTESRIESLLPRLTLDADSDDPKTRVAAENSEKLQKRWLEDSDWETWLGDATKVKSMYGKTVLKPFFNKRERRPDVSVIETPGNLRLGYGSSDYRELDWALYEFTLSPLQAMDRFPELRIQQIKKSGKSSLIVQRHSDHLDPLNQRDTVQTSLGQRDAMGLRGRSTLQPSTYEEQHVRVWDYWCWTIDADGKRRITNAFFVEGVLAAKPVYHDYLPDLPFIVIEHDHDPSTPEGIGDIEPLIDIQIELNRAYSHWAQLIADEIDPAWQINAESVPAGIVPKGGQIVPTGGENAHIDPLEKQVNQFPIRELTEGLMEAFHFRSGLSEILFSLPPGAQTAGRALQIQIEASANRIDPRRRRLYRGLKELLVFWAVMASRIPGYEIRIGTNDDGSPAMMAVKDILGTFTRWQFVAPEITPRDNMELTTTVVNKLNAKLISLEDAMDELGVDSPLEMIRKIEQERMNPRLFPGDTQAYVAVLSMLQQLQAQQAAMGGAPQVPGGDQQGAQQPAAPSGVQGDNGESAPQPATPVGGAGPAGSGEDLSNQTLIRAQPNGGAQALQQIKVTT